MTEEQTFYVEIEDSIAVKRELLESSRSLLYTLQNYERIKEVREKKHQEIKNFQRKMKEISSAINNLKVHLPRINLKEFSKKDQKTGVMESTHSSQTELESIESELSDIERKLNSLG